MLFITNLTFSTNLLPAHASQDSDEKKVKLTTDQAAFCTKVSLRS